MQTLNKIKQVYCIKTDFLLLIKYKIFKNSDVSSSTIVNYYYCFPKPLNFVSC